jgi:hypothetical protein
MTETFRAVCIADVAPDGLVLDPATVDAEVIREDEDYDGVRVTMVAQLGRAVILVQVDIGFGDAVTPAPLEAVLPPLLDFPAVHMRMYPVETVIAEKFETMVKRGLSNTRMKDYYDLFILFRDSSLRPRGASPGGYSHVRHSRNAIARERAAGRAHAGIRGR